MYIIDTQVPSIDFQKAWAAAGRHLSKQSGDASLKWLRSDLQPPMAEHLSFAIGNQLFFVFVEAAEYQFSDKSELFLRACDSANAVPCIFHVEKKITDYIPCNSGWGLIHAAEGFSINPLDLVTDALIEMTDWELLDFAIEVVEAELKKDDVIQVTHQSSLSIDPNVWFKTNEGIFWVVVRAVRFPISEAQIPENISEIATQCQPHGIAGYFASVAVANADNNFENDIDSGLPLYRGHGMYVKYNGLEKLNL